MGCHAFKEKISAHMDHELDAAASRNVASHLERCEGCREYLRDLQGVDLLVHGLPAIEPGPDFARCVVTGARQWDTFSRESEPHRTMLSAVMQHFEGLLDLLKRGKGPNTSTLDEFGDFPPLSMSCVYFKILGHTGGRG